MHLTHITLNSIDFERRILNQALTAASAGHTVRIVALGNRGEPKTERRAFGCLYRIISPFMQGGPLKFIHFNLRLFVLLLQIRTDVIHAHDLWVLPAAAIGAAIRRKKLIYDAHEYYAGLEIFNHHPVRRRLWLLIENRMIRYVDVMLTVSEPLAARYRRRYPRIAACRVVRNLPVRETPSEKLARPIPKPCRNMLVYHGHLKPGRGLENLIRAVALLDDTGLVIIGGGELLGPLRQLVGKLGLGDRVIISDYIPLESLISTSAQADIGVALFEGTSVNYSYALPNKFFEYIMAGLPVLASNIETFSEYIQTYGVGRVVDPSDPVKIAEAVHQMLQDRDALQKWRENCRSAAEILNWDTESAIMLNIYEKLGD